MKQIMISADLFSPGLSACAPVSKQVARVGGSCIVAVSPAAAMPRQGSTAINAPGYPLSET